jgi:hypothetical protein
MDATTLSLELAKMAGTGLVAGIFTAWVAIRDNRFMKWWELRIAAYQSVIDALSDVAYVYDSRLKHENRRAEPNAEVKERLSVLAQEAFIKVRKASRPTPTMVSGCKCGNELQRKAGCR